MKKVSILTTLLVLVILSCSLNESDKNEPNGNSINTSSSRLVGGQITNEDIVYGGTNRYAGNTQSKQFLPKGYVLTGIKAQTRGGDGVHYLSLQGSYVNSNGTLGARVWFEDDSSYWNKDDAREYANYEAPAGYIITGLGGIINKASDFTTFDVSIRSYSSGEKRTVGSSTVHKCGLDRTPLEADLLNLNDSHPYGDKLVITSVGMRQRYYNFYVLEIGVGMLSN